MNELCKDLGGKGLQKVTSLPWVSEDGLSKIQKSISRKYPNC